MNVRDLEPGFHKLQFLCDEGGGSFTDHILEIFDENVQKEVKRMNRRKEPEEKTTAFVAAAVIARIQLHDFLEMEAHGPN